MELFVSSPINHYRCTIPGLQLTGVVSAVAGPLLSPESLVPGADKKMVGSLFIFEAESIEK
jgi:hypothetical protein